MAKAQTTFESTPTPAFPDFTKFDFAKIQADFGKWFGDYSKTFVAGISPRRIFAKMLFVS